MPISLVWGFNHMTKTYYRIIMYDVPGFEVETKIIDVDFFFDIKEVVYNWCSSDYEVYKIIVEKLNLEDY